MRAVPRAPQKYQVPQAQHAFGPVAYWLILGSILLLAAEALGQKILVAGGSPSLQGPYTSTAELFDPATNTWSFTTNTIPNAPPASVDGLCFPNMALLGNGQVLLAGGGCTDAGFTTNASSLYDPATNQWTATGTSTPNFMNFGRDQFGMVTLNGGMALAFAGCAGGCSGPNILGQYIYAVGLSAEVYDYSTNQWTTVASLTQIRGNLASSNLNQGAVVLQDGRVLTCDGTDGFVTPRTTCEIYDPGANTWSQTGAIGETGTHQLVLLSNGNVLTVMNNGISASLFDPVAGTWSVTGPLTSAQIGGQLVRLSDGRVLDCGGTDGQSVSINNVQIYDPSSGQWSVTGPMTTGRFYHLAVLLSDGRVLVAGGEDPNNAILASAEIFDPSVGTWSTTGPMGLQRTQANALNLLSDYLLTAMVSGGGTVSSTDSFLNCPSACVHYYPNNTPVTLNATPQSGWTFTGWSGDCSGTGPCNITMSQLRSVTANFTQTTYPLTVSANGSGTVTSTDRNINCPGVCGYGYTAGTPVTLIANPAQGWTFAGWSGACSGNGSCNVVVTQTLSVTATFTQSQGFHTLSVSISGAGSVTSTDQLINCPGACSATYPSNAQVVLNATPNTGATFAGWSGTCGGVGSCTVTMTQDQSLAATFTGQQDTVTHNFIGNDGEAPVAPLVSDLAGNLYGTTSAGGTYGVGTVFEISLDGNGGSTETVLCTFGNGSDGRNPYAGLILDNSGNLYGTTAYGGVFGFGTVFEISPDGNGGWTETVLYNFGNASDGQYPFAGLIFDNSGNLYGTTGNGGTFGFGTVFELSPNGNGGWAETVLHNFGNSSDGQNPYAGLIFDNSSNLYGTTAYGGIFGGGTTFELSPNGNGGWAETVTYNFGSGSDGDLPHAGLILDASGNLYGTTVYGGMFGRGTAFELSPYGNGGWVEAVLYDFGNGPDGQYPYAGLTFDNSGNLYGTTAAGGLYSGGTVFELAPSNSMAKNNKCCREKTRYSLGSRTDGLNPQAGVIFDNSGNLYGTTANGGTQNLGTVFQIRVVQIALTLQPALISGGQLSIARVALSQPAQTGGLGISISSQNPVVAHMQSLIVVPAGATSTAFAVRAAHVRQQTSVLISATSNFSQTSSILTVSPTRVHYSGPSGSEDSMPVTTPISRSQDPGAALEIKPPPVKLIFESASTKGGLILVSTLTVNEPAPPGGIDLALSSDNPRVAHVPSLVSIPAGATSTSFTITTSAVRQQTVVHITANADSSPTSETLTVNPTYVSPLRAHRNTKNCRGSGTNPQTQSRPRSPSGSLKQPKVE